MIDPKMLLLGAPGPQKHHIYSKELVHVVPRIELDAIPIGTPMYTTAECLKEQNDSEPTVIRVRSFFSPEPHMNQYETRSVRSDCLVKMNKPSICEGDTHYVDCYDFTWFDQVREDLKIRPAVTFISEGNKYRADFARNLAMNLKEFRGLFLFSVNGMMRKFNISREDKLISVLSFVNPEYVIPIFNESRKKSLAVCYRCVSKKFAETKSIKELCNYNIILTDYPEGFFHVDGVDIPVSESTKYKWVPESILETANIDVFRVDPYEKRKKKKVKKAQAGYFAEDLTLEWSNAFEKNDSTTTTAHYVDPPSTAS